MVTLDYESVCIAYISYLLLYSFLFPTKDIFIIIFEKKCKSNVNCHCFYSTYVLLKELQTINIYAFYFATLSEITIVVFVFLLIPYLIRYFFYLYIRHFVKTIIHTACNNTRQHLHRISYNRCNLIQHSKCSHFF